MKSPSDGVLTNAKLPRVCEWESLTPFAYKWCENEKDPGIYQVLRMRESIWSADFVPYIVNSKQFAFLPS